MSEFFIGQVMMASFNFAPKFWAQCNGQLLPINQNQALFSLLGTQFGGNGSTNFALPDLRGRVPIGYASSVDPSWQPPAVQIGQSAGVENVTLLSTHIPAHTHSVRGTDTAGNSRDPTGRVYATNTSTGTPTNLYGASSGAVVQMNSQTVGSSGGNQPHPNMQPYAVVNFCIALSGIFPSRN